MRMSFVDQALFRKFRTYVKDDMPEVAKVGKIRRAFQRYGQLDRASLERALRWGEQPTIDVTPLSGSYGEFVPTPGNNVIKIDTDLVRKFEAGTDLVKTRSGAKVHLAGVTILHEMIHWADNIDGTDYPGEEGEKFERMVYGKVLHL
ncbi:hypothetical protein DXV76_11055 [Rhodobacteraceae bacterium CCMM004]|nr:hypothetical protein DXV76_11055 [Rhodobacteraceae bacterium CCMM004]